MAWGKWRKMALRWLSPWLKSAGTSTGQTLTHSPQPEQMSSSMKRGCLTTFAWKSPGWPESSVSSARLMISMLGSDATSISLGEIMQVEQSLVGKVLSNWAITPPMEMLRSAR